jgi:hypothetical protein
MLKRLAILVVEAMGLAVAGFALVAALLIWRLNQGPISLDFMTPYVERALATPEGRARLRLGATDMIWAGWTRSVDLRARQVQIVAVDGGVIAGVPAVGIRLSLTALARGVVAPIEIQVLQPRLRLVRNPEGALQMGFGDEGGDDAGVDRAASLIADLLAPADPTKTVGLLQRVSILGADLALSDLSTQRFWRVTGADLAFTRGADGLLANLSGIVDLGGQHVQVQGRGQFGRGGGSGELTVAFADLQPGILATYHALLQPLDRLNLPITGAVSLKLDLASGIGAASLSLNAGKGSIALPEVYATPLAVERIEISGHYDGVTDVLDLDRLFVDFGGPSLSATARLSATVGKGLIEAEATARQVPTDSLKHYWPTELGRNARSWVTTNISGGGVPEATVKVTGEITDFDVASLRLKSLIGSLSYEDLTVRYLNPLPPVTGVRGKATFDRSRFDLAVSQGTLRGMRVDQAAIALLKLDVDDATAEIEVVLRGPLADALDVLDRKPLGYPSRLGLAPSGVEGEMATRVRFRFPLSSELTFDEVAVSAAANLRNVRVPKAVKGWDVSHGVLGLRLDGRGMNVSGEARLQGTPISLAWREEFSAEAAVHRTFEVEGSIDDNGRAALGFDTRPYAAGTISARVKIVQRADDVTDIDATLDLFAARLEVPEAGWLRPSGRPATAEIRARLLAGRLVAFETFRIRANDIDLEAVVGIDPSAAIEAASVSRLRFGETDLAASLARRTDGGVDVQIRGSALDLRPALKNDEGKNRKPRWPLSVSANVDRLWLLDETPLDRVAASLDHDGSTWKAIRARGGVGPSAEFALSVSPRQDRHGFLLTSSDAGRLLRAVNLYDDMVGGQLAMEGSVDLDGSGLPYEAQLTIADFKVRNAPVLAQLARLTSLTGILQTLSGEGVGFARLSAHLVQDADTLSIRDALMAGSSIGISANGSIDRKQNKIRIEGTAVPAYSLNQFIGAIPLLGAIITGGRNEGIVAADFTVAGPTDSPEVRVNPLSALAPGLLRRFFRMFGQPENLPEGREGIRPSQRGG